MALQSIDPFNGTIIARYEQMNRATVETIIHNTSRAQGTWRRSEPDERTRCLANLAAVFRERAVHCAELMAKEMGKPVTQGLAEIQKCAACCDYYAENAEALLLPQHVKTEATRSYVCMEPLGVILAIMPWNFPFWQVVRCAVPAHLAGNAIILKHAANVSGCALALERLFHDAFPPDLFRCLLLPSSRIDEVLSHGEIKAVSLTGSTAAGRQVASQAAFLLKKAVLELGGSDPYVILEDADLPSAVTTCVAARMVNSGQSCIAAKRFIAVKPIRARFEEMLVAQMAKISFANPLLEGEHFGPLASLSGRDVLHQQVQKCLNQGAHLRLGGILPKGPGSFYPATVLSGVVPGMIAAEEELFGPVAAILSAENEEQAIALANATGFGLGAAVFTKDTARGETIARDKLQAGSCFVNDYVRSDPRLPFGGIKESGYGRELSSYGFREFTNIKTIFVK